VTILATETVLSEAEARALLVSYVPLDETWGAHSSTVARLAGQIADALAAAGVAIDPALARTGGLIHDIGRSVTHDGIMHCWEGYQMLLAQGQPTLARFCITHSSGGMTAAEAASVDLPAADYRPRTWEEKVVTIADGFAHYDDVIRLADRTASVRARYRDRSTPERYALIERTEGKVRALMDEVEAIIGRSVEDLCGAQSLDSRES
jgi:putative nucleotidyltransferase with HDIG domain